MAAIIKQLQRLFDSVEWREGDDDEERDDLQDTIDEMEEALEEGADVGRGGDRLRKRLERAKASRNTKDNGKGNPPPPGKKDNPGQKSDGDKGKQKKPAAKHGASRTWFGV